MTSKDSVDRALLLLREDDVLPEPNKALEARLRAQYRPPTRRWPLRRLPLTLAALGLGCAVAAASGGVDWIRGLWLVVEVDGNEISGAVGDGKLTTIPFETVDGQVGAVRVQRDFDEAGGQRTRIAIDSRGNQQIEAERLDERAGGWSRERYPVTVLDNALSLYVGEDEQAGRFEFFTTSEPGVSSRVFVLQEDGSERPVVELARLPFDILAPEASAEISVLEGGVLSLSLSDGHGGAIEFSWMSRGSSDDATASSLESADGAVRVHVDNAPKQSSSTD